MPHLIWYHYKLVTFKYNQTTFWYPLICVGFQDLSGSCHDNSPTLFVTSTFSRITFWKEEVFSHVDGTSVQYLLTGKSVILWGFHRLTTRLQIMRRLSRSLFLVLKKFCNTLSNTLILKELSLAGNSTCHPYLPQYKLLPYIYVI